MRSDWRHRRLGALLGAGLLTAAALPAQAGDVAVVVGADVDVDSISLVELRKIFLGDRQYWPSGRSVTLLVPAPPMPERAVLLDQVYRMTESQFKQYWIAKVFRAEAVTGPKSMPSAPVTLQLVGALPGSVALVDARDLRGAYKVLRIDGIAPGERGYALRR
ncbi:MAG: hypothetical protein ACRETF_06420 [Nevskiaceae bacterium]